MPDPAFLLAMAKHHEAKRITITGRQLKACRILAGLTQTDLSKLSGIHRNTISYLENQDSQ